MNEPKYPNITVQLSGNSGNAFEIASNVRMALKQHNVPKNEQEAFFDEALSGDYGHLLTTCSEWVWVQ